MPKILKIRFINRKNFIFRSLVKKSPVKSIPSIGMIVKTVTVMPVQQLFMGLWPDRNFSLIYIAKTEPTSANFTDVGSTKPQEALSIS